MGGNPFHSIGAHRGVLQDEASPDARRLAVAGTGAGTGFLERCSSLLGRAGGRTDLFSDSQSHFPVHTDSRHHPDTIPNRIADLYGNPDSFCYTELHIRTIANRFHNSIAECDRRYKPACDFRDPDGAPQYIHRLPLFHSHGVAHSHPNLDEDPDQSAAANMDRVTDLDAAPDAHPNVDPHTDADSKPNTHLHPNIYAHAHIDTDPNANAVKALMNLHML